MIMKKNIFLLFSLILLTSNIVSSEIVNISGNNNIILGNTEKYIVEYSGDKETTINMFNYKLKINQQSISNDGIATFDLVVPDYVGREYLIFYIDGEDDIRFEINIRDNSSLNNTETNSFDISSTSHGKPSKYINNIYLFPIILALLLVVIFIIIFIIGEGGRKK